MAILFGGLGEEHDISIKSASEIAHSIDKEKYDPIFIGITKSGEWKTCDMPSQSWLDGNTKRAIISPDSATHGLLIETDNGYETVHIDVVIPVIHGKIGEDGTIQGLLELSGIPYVGCDIYASALCMDKSLAYLVVKNAGIATPDFWISDLSGKQNWSADELPYPVFVKPARSGSSFGVTKVSDKSELDAAIKEARQFDSKVLIEAAIRGTEVGCAVLGNGSDLEVGEVDQISIKYGFFRIHQEENPEQGSENSAFIVPAQVQADDYKRIQETAKAIYQALGCTGLARVDTFLQDDGTVVLNEVNTFPGFTSYSRYPRMMKAAGHTITEIIDRFIALALNK